MDVSKLNMDFLNKAEKITQFNIPASDFTNLTYKKEIQYLFKKHFFPSFNLDKTMTSRSLNMKDANILIDSLKAMDFDKFNKLHFYNLKGVGPGEATLYFLHDHAHLGGGTSAGVDLVVGSSKYEIKAAQLTGDKKAVFGFKLGGTVPLGDLVNKAMGMKQTLGLTTAGKGQSELNKSQIEQVRKKFPKEWGEIETEYGKRAFSYFENDNVIFMNNNNSSGKLTRAAGGIIAIKKVQMKDIRLDVITQGTIKPKVLL